MGGNFSDILHLLKNGGKSDSFAAHSEQHFSSDTSHTDLRKYMTLKVLQHLKPFSAMKAFTKPSYNLCMDKLLTILKKIPASCVMVMNKN